MWKLVSGHDFDFTCMLWASPFFCWSPGTGWSAQLLLMESCPSDCCPSFSWKTQFHRLLTPPTPLSMNLAPCPGNSNKQQVQHISANSTAKYYATKGKSNVPLFLCLWVLFLSFTSLWVLLIIQTIVILTNYSIRKHIYYAFCEHNLICYNKWNKIQTFMHVFKVYSLSL